MAQEREKNFKIMMQEIVAEINNENLMHSCWVLKYKDEEMSVRVKMMWLMMDEEFRRQKIESEDTLAKAMYYSATEEKEMEKIPFELWAIIFETARSRWSWKIKSNEAIEKMQAQRMAKMPKTEVTEIGEKGKEEEEDA